MTSLRILHNLRSGFFGHAPNEDSYKSVQLPLLFAPWATKDPDASNGFMTMPIRV